MYKFVKNLTNCMNLKKINSRIFWNSRKQQYKQEVRQNESKHNSVQRNTGTGSGS